MKIVVTGGAGYIGSVIVAHLLEVGHEVVVIDNLSRGHEDAVPSSVRLIKANVADFGEVIKPRDKIDAIIHLASFIDAGESVQRPAIYWENNVLASLKLLEAVRKLGIKKYIFSSTAAVYGSADSPAESAHTKPTNPYGMTKLAFDMALTSYAVAYGLAATSLRYFNVAGAYGTCGERHAVETHIIPLALATAAGERDKFLLFGDDYSTPDGTCVRDYIHVADLARAHLLALDTLLPGEHTIYNLGNGNGFSNKQVIAAVERVTGETLPVEIQPRRQGDPAIIVASSQKAKSVLGWEPLKPTLDEIVQDAWTFYLWQRDKSLIGAAIQPDSDVIRGFGLAVAQDS